MGIKTKDLLREISITCDTDQPRRIVRVEIKDIWTESGNFNQKTRFLKTYTSSYLQDIQDTLSIKEIVEEIYKELFKLQYYTDNTLTSTVELQSGVFLIKDINLFFIEDYADLFSKELGWEFNEDNFIDKQIKFYQKRNKGYNFVSRRLEDKDKIKYDYFKIFGRKSYETRILWDA